MQYSVTPTWHGLAHPLMATTVFEDFTEGFRHYNHLFEDKGVHVDRIDVAKFSQHDIGEYYRLLGIIDSPPQKLENISKRIHGF